MSLRIFVFKHLQFLQVPTYIFRGSTALLSSKTLTIEISSSQVIKIYLTG